MKNKKTLIISMLAIVVVGLAIGFAAFSSSLTISSSSTVTPSSSTFKVCLSETGTACSVSKTITPTVVGNVDAPYGFIVLNQFWTAVDSGGTKKSIGFTEPGESVTYNMYIRNDGEYTAYLNSIEFADETSTDISGNTVTAFKICGSVGVSNPPTDSLLNAACNFINATVTVNNGTKTETATNATKSGIDGFSLAPGATATVTIKFEYEASGTRADGSFYVSFGDIKFNYSTVD